MMCMWKLRNSNANANSNGKRATQNTTKRSKKFSTKLKNIATTGWLAAYTFSNTHTAFICCKSRRRWWKLTDNMQTNQVNVYAIRHATSLSGLAMQTNKRTEWQNTSYTSHCMTSHRIGKKKKLTKVKNNKSEIVEQIHLNRLCAHVCVCESERVCVCIHARVYTTKRTCMNYIIKFTLHVISDNIFKQEIFNSTTLISLFNLSVRFCSSVRLTQTHTH